MNSYFYIDSEGKQRGPLTIEELRNEPIRKENMVWTQGMADWKRANDVVEMLPLFEISSTTETQFGVPPNHPAQQATINHDVPAMPKSWMVESILVTILPFVLCGNVFALLGIAAIVNASKVESLYHQGLFSQANEASSNAARWTKITFWIAIAAIVLAIVGVIIAVVFFGSLAGIGNALSI